MHGRLKVISTEEQKLKQQKVREAKLKAYTEAMSRIIEKRSKNEYDDEALVITREVLQANPDIITLWNYRREVFLLKKADLDSETFDNKLKEELSLTEGCLRINPKSYGTWHYRTWVLDNLPKTEWQKEIKLCDKYLTYDERNFHAWHYRKVVIERAQIPAQDEYNFTTSKIESNFSNYSAWHFRSKLLPKLFEDPDGKFPISEEVHKEELGLVQNAAFTDPDDQSAWFYQRWLLALRRSGVSIAYVERFNNKIVLATSRPIHKGKAYEIHVDSSQVAVNGVWTNAPKGSYSAFWCFEITDTISTETELVVSLRCLEDTKIVDTVTITGVTFISRQPDFSPNYSESLKAVVQEQLNSCQELLQLEPDSKWTLLTSVFLMRYLNLSEHFQNITESILHLMSVDPYRNGYYSDLSSQIRIEHYIIQFPFSKTFSMPSSKLTGLYHSQYLVQVEHVDLKNNQLKDNDLKLLAPLVHCSCILLDGNLITSFSSMPLLVNLETLSLSGNPLTDPEADRKYLSAFVKLTNLTL